MRLAEFLRDCKETFVSQARAGMKRDGIPEEAINESLANVEALLEDYNDNLLRAFGMNIVVPMPSDKPKA